MRSQKKDDEEQTERWSRKKQTERHVASGLSISNDEDECYMAIDARPVEDSVGIIIH